MMENLVDNFGIKLEKISDVNSDSKYENNMICNYKLNDNLILIIT